MKTNVSQRDGVALKVLAENYSQSCTTGNYTTHTQHAVTFEREVEKRSMSQLFSANQQLAADYGRLQPQPQPPPTETAARAARLVCM